MESVRFQKIYFKISLSEGCKKERSRVVCPRDMNLLECADMNSILVIIYASNALTIYMLIFKMH